MSWVDRREIKARESPVTRSTQPPSDFILSIAWLPVVIFLITIMVLAFIRIDVAWNPPNLLKVLNITFLTIITFLVSLLAGRSYLGNHSSFFLLFGCGMLALGLGGALVGLPLGKPGPNWTVTIYNLSAFLAGLCLITSAIEGWSVKPWRLRSGWPALLVFYLGIIVIESILALAVRNERLPLFFVDGRGATIYNLLILWTTVGLFTASAILLRFNYGAGKSNFYYWCTLGLGLIAVGLLGVSLQTRFGSPLNWTSRFSQYLGGVYLLIATISSVRQSGTWMLPLEKALRESEARYRALVELSPDGVIVHRNGSFLYANSVALKMYGADTLEQLQTKSVPDLIHPDDRDAIKARMQMALVEQRVPLRETRMMSLDGRITPVETVGSMVDFQGEPAVQIIIRDITERKRTEEILQERTLFLNETQKIARMGGWKANPHTDYLEWSDGVYDIIEEPLDYHPCLLDGLKYYLPEYIPIITDRIADCLATGKPFSVECQVITTTGKRLWTEVRGLAHIIEGERSYVIGTFQDITERKYIEKALEESKERFRAITSSTPDHILVQDHELRYSMVINPQLGLSEQDMIGKTDFDIMPKKEADILTNIKRQVLETGKSVHVEMPLDSPTGGQQFFDGSYIPKFDEQGRVDGLIGYFKNITKHKQAEEELKQSINRFRVLTQNLSSGVALIDEHGQFSIVNPAFLKIFELPEESDIMNVNNRNWAEWQVYDESGTLMEVDEHPIRKAAMTGKAVRNRLVGVCGPSGSESKWILISAEPIFKQDGRMDATICTFHDITERKQIETALEKSERNLVEAQRIGHIGSWEWNIQTGVVQWSAELYSIYGVDPDNFIPSIHSFASYVHPDDQEYVNSVIDQILSTGILANFDFRIVSADGSTRILNVIGEITDFDNNGKPLLMVGVNQDITERKQDEALINRHNLILLGISQILEEAIRCETEEELGRTCLEVVESITGSKFSFIGEIGPDGLHHDIAISDPGCELCTMYDKEGHRRPPGDFVIHGLYGRVLQDGISLMTNNPSTHPDSIGIPEGHPVLTAFLGVPLLYDNKTIGLIAVANREGGYRLEDQEDLESLAPVVVETLLRKRAEEELRNHREHLEDLVRDRTIELKEKNILLQEEITQRERVEGEKKGLENQLIQAQKMEALGRFAGGIAHDLNNILYPIIIDTESLLEEAEQGTSSHLTLSQVLKAANRQKDLIKQILSFSRRSEQLRRPIKVIPILKETIDLLHSSLPRSIKIKQDIDTQSDIIIGDPTQIQQIIMNLCRNAADAIGSQKGTIEVSLTNTYLEPSPAHPDIKEGQYLKLIVKDTGHGITKEVMEKIFEPFFTTKEAGKGSGMGLAVVHGILKHYEGTITVESEEGKGSKFTVYLPITDEKIETQITAIDKAHSLKGKGKVLLIDDEDIILSSLQTVLKRMEYEVVAINDGLEAYEIFLKAPSDFVLVITDLSMPQITGVELANKLMDIRPDIPIILCTGFNDVIDEENAKSMGIRELLLKPASTNELKEAIERALDNS